LTVFASGNVASSLKYYATGWGAACKYPNLFSGGAEACTCVANSGGYTIQAQWSSNADGTSVISCAIIANGNYYLVGIVAAYFCPSHSTGTSTCTCNNPTATDPVNYVPDTTQTRCVPEQLTIALGGLGGEVMPTKTRAAYAEVKTNSGALKSGAQVFLSLDVSPELQGQLPVTYTGSLSTYGGSTGADGRLTFEFRAPVAGGLHVITAGCVGCTNVAQGTIKVPGCSVDDVPPIDPAVQPYEDNPDLSDTEHLTDDMKTALEKLQAAVKAAGSSSTVGSAYRPPAYNQHLIDVWKKWVRELKKNDEPACTALKTKIQAHFKRHKLKESQSPVPGSRHTKGEAVDVTISPDIPNIDTLAKNCCNLRRPLPVDDSVHFQFP
jgi:hypothetical protein